MNPPIQLGRTPVAALVAKAEALTGISASDLLGRNRTHPVSHVRFAVMRAANEAGRSLNQIGRVLGGLDHTSVYHGIRRSHELEACDPDFAHLVRALTSDRACNELAEELAL